MFLTSFVSLSMLYRLPLRDMKKKILRNLKVLEQQNLVTSKNDYQDIVNAIAKVNKNTTRPFHSLFVCAPNDPR